MFTEISSRLVRALALLSLFTAFILSVVQSVDGLSVNSHSIALLHHLYSVDNEQWRSLYSVRSDVATGFMSLDVNNFEDSASGISLRAIQMGLENDYAGIAALTEQFSAHCRLRPSCRFLAGKAHFRLEQDSEVVYFWRDDRQLWNRLVGNVAMTPGSGEDLRILERYYSILQTIEPEEAAPPFMLGSIYRSQGSWNQAIPFFQTALDRETENARYQCALGEALVRTQQDIPYGLQLCLLATKQSPRDMWIYHQSAQTHALAGECEIAGQLYEYIAHNFPDRSEPTIWVRNFRSGSVGLCFDDE